MVSSDVVGIGSEYMYFVVYLSCVYIYVRLIMSSYLFFCTWYQVSASMFGISHVVQNEKLWNLQIG